MEWLLHEQASKQTCLLKHVDELVDADMALVSRNTTPCNAASAIFVAASEYETTAAAVLIAAHEVYNYAQAVRTAAQEEMQRQCTPQ